MKALTAQEALITLYNSTRLAPLTLEQHDNNRACVDVLAQVLGIKLEWTVPVPEEKTEESSKEEVAKVSLTDEDSSTESASTSKKNKKNKK